MKITKAGKLTLIAKELDKLLEAEVILNNIFNELDEMEAIYIIDPVDVKITLDEIYDAQQTLVNFLNIYADGDKELKYKIFTE